MTTHHLRILSEPGQPRSAVNGDFVPTPGKAIYASRREPLDISFRYTEDWKISACVVGSAETFQLIPLMDKEMLTLVGIQQVYPDGTTATFVKEGSGHTPGIQDAVPETGASEANKPLANT